MLKAERLLCCAAKLGNSKEDYEDAFTSLDSFKSNDDGLRIAISDGATESSFSKEWANILVNSFSNKTFDLENDSFLLGLVNQWKEKIKDIDLTWFASQKVNAGAYATFLGIDLDLRAATWSAVSVGDSCLFVVREGQLLKSFPLTNESEFGNNPDLISSLENGNLNLETKIKKMSGTLRAGDLIILATDALSAWFLRTVHDSKQPWLFFDQLVDTDKKKKEKSKLFDNWLSIKKQWTKKEGSMADNFDNFVGVVFKAQPNKIEIERWSFLNWIFQNWLNELREMKGIKNDDTTIFLLKIT